MSFSRLKAELQTNHGSWRAPFRFFRMHWDHEPDRAGATSAASRSVTAEYYDAPGFGLLVGEIGSG
jgi:hypothetical protein